MDPWMGFLLIAWPFAILGSLVAYFVVTIGRSGVAWSVWRGSVDGVQEIEVRFDGRYT